MKFLLVFFLCVLSFSQVAFAETDEIAKKNETKLVLSIRRIGLDMSKTQVSNAAEYADSPISLSEEGALNVKT